MKKLKVLYVEDVEETREAVGRFLSKRVELLISCRDGEEGYDYFVFHRPDLVITDLMMPKLNGIKMIEKIRLIDKDVPILVITAHASESFVSECSRFKIDQYMLKPVNVERLSCYIHSLELKLEHKASLELIMSNFLKLFDESGDIAFFCGDDFIEVNQPFLNYFSCDSFQAFKEQYQEKPAYSHFLSLIHENGFTHLIDNRSFEIKVQKIIENVHIVIMRSHS